MPRHFAGICSINEIQKTNSSFNIYPNPGSNCSIHITHTGIELNVSKVVIMDLSGRTIKSEQYSGSDSMVVADVSALSAGTYLIQILTDRGVITQKFVKS